MTFVPLDIPPGVVKTRSGEGAMGRWSDALNVRFVAGKPEKRAGFEQINTVLLDGKARGMEAWNDLTGQGLYAVGTNTKLYGSTDGLDVINITPLRFQQEWVDKLSTTIHLGAVSVAMTAHGYSVGKPFKIYGNSFQGGSLVGGIALNGLWEIVSVTDADNFKLYPSGDKGTLAADPFATVNTSANVTVTHTAHGRATGDAVWFSGAAAVNGITIAGDYQITVINANSYTITHSAPATGTGSGGGSSVAYHYGSGATSTVAAGGGTVPYYTYLTDPFATTDTSTTVTVTHVGHGAARGDTIVVDATSNVGGLVLDGEYTIDTVIDADTYEFTAASAATSTDTGGGSTLIEYEISIGPADKITATLRGFGTGALGSGFFGASGPASDSTYYDPRTWSIDKNGEDAIACPLGGTIYYWDSSAAGRADAIPNAPGSLRYACMTEERHLHALGIDGDPLKFGWATQDAMSDWTPTAINTANNSRRVREGSTLVAMAPVGAGMNLIWTDTAQYVHQYTGSKFVYDTRLGTKGAGLIAPQAFAVTPLGVCWMGQKRFWMWNGSTTPIPRATDIETWVFGNIDANQKSKCFAHYDAVNNSVDFYFVPSGGSEPSLYVTVNLDDFTWVNGTQTRTTGATFDAGAQQPLRVNEGKVYRHEVGFDADGVSAPSSLTLAPYEIGKKWSELLGFDPDFKRQTGDLEISVMTYDRNATVVEDTETETVSTTDQIVDLRVSGRHVSITLSQDVLGGDWALDTPQIDVKTSAARR